MKCRRMVRCLHFIISDLYEMDGRQVRCMVGCPSDAMHWLCTKVHFHERTLDLKLSFLRQEGEAFCPVCVFFW